MKEQLAEALVNILKIKSIVTLATTLAFVILSLRGDIETGQFMTIFTVIIGFYFGTQKVKENEGEIGKVEEYAPEDTEILYDAVYHDKQ